MVSRVTKRPRKSELASASPSQVGAHGEEDSLGESASVAGDAMNKVDGDGGATIISDNDIETSRLEL